MKRTIPEGFRQARSQLGNYDVMNDRNNSDLDSTLNSVMEKMEQFEETMIGKINGEGSINLEAEAQAGAGSNAKAA